MTCQPAGIVKRPNLSSPMIRVVLRGRTGNTFFQYAVGRCLALRHEVPLVLDASWMNGRDYRQALQLRRLSLAATIERGPAFAARSLRALNGSHWLEWRFRDIGREPEGDHRFNRKILELGASTLLIGYFQSWCYFEPIRPQLLRELDLSELPWTRFESELQKQLEDCESVAVHVRRTDYLDHELTRVCDESYQHRAIERLRVGLDSPQFFIFSDDPDWCRQTFGSYPDCRVVEIPGSADDPFIDMRMMSKARHNIIVNSSYSWWAAWLNSNPEQKVIAPGRWGNGGALAPIEEKVPAGWLIDRQSR